MANNQAFTFCEELFESEDVRVPADSNSLLLYLVGCGIVWRGEGRKDALRELMIALHHFDPVVRCIAAQMVELGHGARTL